MALLYASLALLLGVAAGRFAWEAGWLNCALPDWLWLVPALLLAVLSFERLIYFWCVDHRCVKNGVITNQTFFR